MPGIGFSPGQHSGSRTDQMTLLTRQASDGDKSVLTGFLLNIVRDPRVRVDALDGAQIHEARHNQR
jgi:hypothetical protein